MKETGAHAVKLEGGERSHKQIRRIVGAGIPVMAHIGFTPQSEHGLGGHVIQGRGEGVEQLLADAQAVQEAGAFAVVLEMVPADAARQVTELLEIPTIGVGAGPARRRPAARLDRLGRPHDRARAEVREAVRRPRGHPQRRREGVARRRASRAATRTPSTATSSPNRDLETASVRRARHGRLSPPRPPPRPTSRCSRAGSRAPARPRRASRRARRDRPTATANPCSTSPVFMLYQNRCSTSSAIG